MAADDQALSFSLIKEKHTHTSFGELVLDRMDANILAEINHRMQRELKCLPKKIRKNMAVVLDAINSRAKRKSWWTQDVSEALEQIVDTARDCLESEAIQVSEPELCRIFELAVLNFGFSAYRSNKIKRFIKSSVGRGWIDILFRGRI